MSQRNAPQYSRRERQVMQTLYRLGEASVADIESEIPDAPSYDAVRLTLVALTEKGHVRHRREGRRYIYSPAVPLSAASRSAARQLLSTYFRGSLSQAILTLIDEADHDLSDGEIEEIAELVRQAKEDRE